MHIVRPSEESGIPLALAHPAERAEKSPPRKPSLIDAFFRFLRRGQHSFDSFDHICLPYSPESLVRETQTRVVTFRRTAGREFSCCRYQEKVPDT
jgi:hypothetical protein